MPTITPEDEGKVVVNAAGDRIGVVTDVEQSTAHIKSDVGFTETLKAKLGWGDATDDTVPLQEEAIQSITDNEVRLVTDK